MNYDELVHSIGTSITAMNDLGVREYAPIVEYLLRSRNRDARQIEHTLDRLLGFCGDERALLLYRRLCRHYWDIDPVATVDYVNAYREMWDSDEEAASTTVSGKALAAGVSHSASEEPAASAVPLRETRP